MKCDVAVVGGGPAGLAAARGIQRASPGARVVVLERRPRLEPLGSGIVLGVNAIRAMEFVAPKPLDEVIASSRKEASRTRIYKHSPFGVPKGIEEHAVLDSYGEEHTVIEGTPQWDAAEAKYGVRPCPTAWHLLQSALARDLPEETELRLGASVTAIKESSAGGLRIAIDGSDEDVEARLVVGADGYFSRVRSQFIGDGPPEYVGSAVIRALVDQPEDGDSILYSGDNKVSVQRL